MRPLRLPACRPEMPEMQFPRLHEGPDVSALQLHRSHGRADGCSANPSRRYAATPSPKPRAAAAGSDRQHNDRVQAGTAANASPSTRTNVAINVNDPTAAGPA